MSLFSNNIVGPMLGFLLGLIPLVILHEIGHFIMAKLTGVWAREFGIGYPPRIMTLFHWQETAFTLNWLPLGGFVRMEGEELFEDPDAPPSPPPTPEELLEKKEAQAHSLYSKSPGQRVLIYLGGPVMNMITAWVLAVALFMSGVPMYEIGIVEVASNSPAEAADMRAGDILVAIDDEPVEDGNAVSELIQANLGQPTNIVLRRENEEFIVSVTPRIDPPQGEGALGIMMGGIEKEGAFEYYSFSTAVNAGSSFVVSAVRLILSIPGQLLSGAMTLAEARPGGVVSISRMTQYSFMQSFSAGSLYPLLYTLILLNISLGIFNLLPIPALDGGRILFIIIEKIRQKPLTPEMEERIHIVAFAVLMVLFLVITAMDILYPIQFP